MSKQTAVEWLFEQIANSPGYYQLIEHIESKSTKLQINNNLNK
jgi:hypothetical protein